KHQEAGPAAALQEQTAHQQNQQRSTPSTTDAAILNLLSRPDELAELQFRATEAERLSPEKQKLVNKVDELMEEQQMLHVERLARGDPTAHTAATCMFTLDDLEDLLKKGRVSACSAGGGGGGAGASGGWSRTSSARNNEVENEDKMNAVEGATPVSANPVLSSASANTSSSSALVVLPTAPTSSSSLVVPQISSVPPMDTGLVLSASRRPRGRPRAGSGESENSQPSKPKAKGKGTKGTSTAKPRQKKRNKGKLKSKNGDSSEPSSSSESEYVPESSN
ncbi:unnamed protein product, partial [Amoebophrya sp. A25]